MKKGVSPLIATVLLIGTTIVIAAIVSTFIVNQTKKFDPEDFVGSSMYCQDVVLGMRDLNVDEVFDHNGQNCKKLRLNLVNKGMFTVYKVEVAIDGLGDSSVVDFGESGLAPGDPFQLNLAICQGGNIRIVPHIKIEEEEIVCTESEMVINGDKLKIFGDD